MPPWRWCSKPRPPISPRQCELIDPQVVDVNTSPRASGSFRVPNWVGSRSADRGLLAIGGRRPTRSAVRDQKDLGMPPMPPIDSLASSVAIRVLSDGLSDRSSTKLSLH